MPVYDPKFIFKAIKLILYMAYMVLYTISGIKMLKPYDLLENILIDIENGIKNNINAKETVNPYVV